MLRILCLIPLATALKWSIGLQWMMISGMGRLFSKIAVCSCFLYLGLAGCIVPLLGSIGMAVTVTAVEIAIPAACYTSVKASGMNPFSRTLLSHVRGEAAICQQHR
jgi:hypothetical protein